MEINIMFDKDGRFTIDKSDDLGSFMAVGMLELAKKLLLEPENKNRVEEVEGQVSIDEVQ